MPVQTGSSWSLKNFGPVFLDVSTGHSVNFLFRFGCGLFPSSSAGDFSSREGVEKPFVASFHSAIQIFPNIVFENRRNDSSYGDR